MFLMCFTICIWGGGVMMSEMSARKREITWGRSGREGGRGDGEIVNEAESCSDFYYCA